MLEWRLKAYRHWLTMKEPHVAQGALSADRLPGHHLLIRAQEQRATARRASTKWIRSCWRLTRSSAFPCSERERLAGVAVDAVFDSVSVGTTFKKQLAEKGVIFCSFSEAVQEHPDLVSKYLGSVVPYTDNFYAALNSAVFTDGSFCYIPKGVRCPMELSTYFRINAANTGQFERTLIIAEEGAHVSYLEGCTAPMRDENQLHAAVVELIALDNARNQILDRAELVSGRRTTARAASTISSPSAAHVAKARTRRFPGRRSRPARPSPGNIRAAFCRATIRSASSIPSR